MSEKSLTHGIKFKDKIGYAMGDMGGLLTFSLIGAFQNKFYTDVLHIQPAKIVVLILVARLWDAINDPIWGAFIDSRKPTKQGKFRPYVFWFSIPLAVSAVLMFTVIPNLSEAKYLLFAYITYILYGMMYTCVNIPYGSLASVVTDDEKERSSLSMWRSIGAGLGGLPSTILFPMLVYNTTIAADGTKIQTLDGNKLTIGVLILAILSVVIFFGHYKLTKERIAPIQKKKGDYNAFKDRTAAVPARRDRTDKGLKITVKKLLTVILIASIMKICNCVKRTRGTMLCRSARDNTLRGRRCSGRNAYPARRNTR